MARPRKPVKERIGKDGLFLPQRVQIQNEANSRGLPYAFVLREAIDWYLSAKLSARVGSVATFKDDIDHEELVNNVRKVSKKNKSNQTNQKEKGK